MHCSFRHLEMHASRSYLISTTCQPLPVCCPSSPPPNSSKLGALGPASCHVRPVLSPALISMGDAQSKSDVRPFVVSKTCRPCLFTRAHKACLFAHPFVILIPDLGNDRNPPSNYSPDIVLVAWLLYMPGGRSLAFSVRYMLPDLSHFMAVKKPGEAGSTSEWSCTSPPSVYLGFSSTTLRRLTQVTQ
ncbi:hypothetical protein LY76DRAFT_64254 [Colletotrichum caudatum]|nr:hypothetical protein LY76DRAFT_64254 [Colletotrichum caudatum]